MKIQNINNHKPSFKSYSVMKFNDQIPFYTTTMFFRKDLDWDALVNKVNDEYKNVPKVNVIFHACSDGEEVFSFAAKLKTMLKSSSEKFFPLIAKDIDKGNIEIAKKGKYKVTKQELFRMHDHCGDSLFKYFSFDDLGNLVSTQTLKILRDKVIFKDADILEDAENIPRRNTILFCRNFWGYISPTSRVNLANLLARRLDSSSLLVIGGFDIATSVHQLLKKVGFERTEIFGVFRKIPK